MKGSQWGAWGHGGSWRGSVMKQKNMCPWWPIIFLRKDVCNTDWQMCSGRWSWRNWDKYGCSRSTSHWWLIRKMGWYYISGTRAQGGKGDQLWKEKQGKGENMYRKWRGPRPYTEAGLWTACKHHLCIKMFFQSTEPIEHHHRCGGARTLFPEHDDKQGEVRFWNEMSKHDVPMMTSAFPSTKLILISTAQDFFLPAGTCRWRQELKGQINIHVVISVVPGPAPGREPGRAEPFWARPSRAQVTAHQGLRPGPRELKAGAGGSGRGFLVGDTNSVSTIYV